MGQACNWMLKPFPDVLGTVDNPFRAPPGLITGEVNSKNLRMNQVNDARCKQSDHLHNLSP